MSSSVRCTKLAVQRAGDSRGTARLWLYLVFAGSGSVGVWLFGAAGLSMLGLAVWLAQRADLDAGQLLRAQGAVPLGHRRFPGLHGEVAQLARRAAIEPPALYLLPDRLPNAAAVQGTQGPAAVGVTAGLLEQLPADELHGVLAHEIAHLRNGDTGMRQLAGALIRGLGWLSILAVLLHSLGTDEMDLLDLLAAGLCAGLSVVLASHALAALSRHQELAADATAAALTGQPGALARALVRMEVWRRPAGAGGLSAWPGSHPPTGQRVARLAGLLFEAPVSPAASPSIRPTALSGLSWISAGRSLVPGR